MREAPAVRGIPLLGSYLDFRRDLLVTLAAGFRRHGDLIRYRVGPVTVYAVSSPELADEVLADDERFGKLGDGNPLRLVLGDGLLTNADRDAWRRNRRMMQPAYVKQRVAAMSTTMSSRIDEWLVRVSERYQPGERMELHDELNRISLDIVGHCMFGVDVLRDVDALGPHAIDIAVDFPLQRLLQNPLSPPLRWPTPGNRRFRRVLAGIDARIHRLIAERRAAFTTPSPSGGDLLDALLAGGSLPTRQVRDEILTALAAGHETTAVAICWALYLLSTHPEALRRVQAEVDGRLAGRVPTIEDLPGLPFTLRVLEEGMRLYPPAPLLLRHARAETALGGYRVPADARMLISVYNVHRHPRHWPDPDRFDPDRFDPDRFDPDRFDPDRFGGRAGWHRSAYLPFGGGPHLCIGRQFALVQSHLLLAALAQRYELRLAEPPRVVGHAKFTLRPRYGMPMTVHPR